MTDEQIVELFWSRSESAIAETAKKYQTYCWSIAYNILGDFQDADECVNDTYLKTWHAIPEARPKRLSTFLGKIARNVSIDVYKKKHRGKRGGRIDVALDELSECLPADESVEDRMETKALAKTIDAFLKKLPRRQRVMFVCRYWYLSSIAQIAADLGMSESNVKTTLFRIRNKLKTYLEEMEVYG